MDLSYLLSMMTRLLRQANYINISLISRYVHSLIVTFNSDFQEHT